MLYRITDVNLRAEEEKKKWGEGDGAVMDARE